MYCIERPFWTIVQWEKPKFQLILPSHLTTRALKGCHNQVGHQGIVKTLSLLRERFYWPQACIKKLLCMLISAKIVWKGKQLLIWPLYSQLLPNQPMELVHMDFLFKEPSKEKYWKCTCHNWLHFTRYAQAYPSKTQTAQATAKMLWENFIRHYGFPEKFLSDQGRNFESEFISELCKLAQVEKVHTTPYHPMTIWSVWKI